MKTKQQELQTVGDLRNLLFGTGHALEDAIIGALQLLAFKAERYKDSESEFDVVFVSPEGRLIGEAEGKNDKAINIEKMDQLQRNIHEDFAKSVDPNAQYAKGVLFGNAFRLTKPSERGEFFTQKCMQSAKQFHVALVRTPDLFDVVHEVRERPDEAYMEACREAILNTSGGVVNFPNPNRSIESAPLRHNSEDKI